MQRRATNPTSVYSAGYNERTQTFEVELQSGKVYQYYDLPQKVYEDFTQAKSKTLFYNEKIRDVYAFSRIA